MRPRDRMVERVVPHPFSAREERQSVLKRVRDNALLLGAVLILSIGFTGCGDRNAPQTDKTKNSEKITATAWPMTRGGPALSGNVSAKLPVNPATAWTFTAASSISAEATIVGGHVYVGTVLGVL